jgi:hypothetical protein
MCASSVLIITEREDIHGHALIWALNRAGVRCDRWSFSEFPEKQHMSVRISNSTATPQFQIPGVAGDYASIWLRRLALPNAMPASLAPADIPMASVQARRSAEGIRSIFSPHSVWINPLRVRENANAKPSQLLAARSAGFPVPETLISNDPEEIRKFYHEHHGDVICKFFAPAFWRNRTTGTLSGLFTARLSEDLLADDMAFTSCPAIYQRHVHKAADVRITFFGRSYWAVRIRSQQSSSGKVDFRSDMTFESPAESMQLTEACHQRCIELSSRLGLLHGSYDFIEHSDGSLTFLEVNEMGQFLWLEERLPELPLLSAFAAFSLDARPNFRFDPARWPAHSFHEFLKSDAYGAFRRDLAAAEGEPPFHYAE